MKAAKKDYVKSRARNYGIERDSDAPKRRCIRQAPWPSPAGSTRRIVARAHGLTNYDAAYLTLSLQLKLPLATTDGNLRRAIVGAGAELFAI